MRGTIADLDQLKSRPHRDKLVPLVRMGQGMMKEKVGDGPKIFSVSEIAVRVQLVGDRARCKIVQGSTGRGRLRVRPGRSPASGKVTGRMTHH